MHHILPFILAMIAAIIFLEMLATKLRVAYPIVLVLAGLLVSFIPGLPRVTVSPDLIFFLFLPPLLFEAAWSISFKEMRQWWRMITSFAFLVVFFTAFSVAIATQLWIPGFTLALGFLLGGIVSPPDAVSAGTITKFVKIPRATATILEGESLLNDASSLIIFQFALLAVTTGQFDAQAATGSFLWMVFGGAGIGLVIGWLFIQMHRRLPTDASSDVVFTLLEPYFLYWVAEQLHASGVLAVVAGGLLMANNRLLFLNSTSRIRAYGVWESFVFILNGLVFLLIGLQLPEIVSGLRTEGISLGTAIGYGLLVTVILILTRMISGFVAIGATILFRRSVMHHHGVNIQRWWTLPMLIGWTGMRGVVSLAAALAIPVSLANGNPFPYRSLILFITFVVILLTLLVQGLTLPYFIRRSGIYEAEKEEAKEEQARKQMKQSLKEHIYSQLKNKQAHCNNPMLQRMVEQWEERIKHTNPDAINAESKVLFLEILKSQRQHLLELNKDPQLDEEIVRQQLYQIDLEEERLRML